jgi:hypothetical protein
MGEDGLSPTGVGGVVAWQTATAPHGVLACPSEGTRWRTGYAALIDRHWARARAELLHHVLGLDCRIEADAAAPPCRPSAIATDDMRQSAHSTPVLLRSREAAPWSTRKASDGDCAPACGDARRMAGVMRARARLRGRPGAHDLLDQLRADLIMRAIVLAT